ncbi:putative feruloyl esterase B-2 [Colletotrichum spinosum]|uniref:Carboxylic ester hydrolase n=1 Tax=Colletotrichum spinosum TaxID=1347390 RepID=A0A4R8PM43_9PEZI|nr:putative feruloyl esterase B-2 [Colletotrichum spinosum]
MKWITSFTLTLAALRQVAATNSTSCTPRLMSYWINANASISVVEPIDEDGSFGEEGNIAYPGNVTGLPSLCAVSFIAKTGDGNQTYKFGLFLPDEWNNDVLTVGNDGFEGGVNWPAMAAGVKYGFATLSTDGGHNSTANNLTWALDDEDAREDFGIRALHGSYALALQVIRRYYSLPPEKSYFSGSGDGGRQGLKAAQQHPRDFNAIVVGAPEWWPSHQQSWRVSRGALNQPNDTKILDEGNFTVLADNIKKQCDASDGLEDGIVSNPANCTVDFSLFTCGGDSVNETSCLTAEQVEVAKAIYSDYEVDGQKVFPGLAPGSEHDWGYLLGNGSNISEIAVGYFQNFVYDDPEWDWKSYNDSIPEFANETNAGDLDVADFNLTTFASLGHKLIIYHGLADASAPANASIDFYEKVVNATGGDAEATRGWFRLFLVPGYGHTNTSVDAPWYIGGPGQWEQLANNTNATIPGFKNATYDVLSALVQWQVDGTAPESIIATTWTNSTDASTEVLRQRPICAYPAEQKYKGEGDETKPESFEC